MSRATMSRSIVCLLGVAAALALSLSVNSASANDVYATYCGGVLPDPAPLVYTTDGTVCVAGDVDFVCPGRLGVNLPGADVYAVRTGADPFSGVPIHFDALGGFGSFWDQTVMLPPLAPGLYDLFLDEHCDGIQTADDVLKVGAFLVGGVPMCSMPPGPPVDPGISSGSTCRGACGGDCPSTCSALPPTTACEEDAASCQHVDCTITGMSCGTHEGCRIHDDCYDACAASGGGFWCRRGCDVECLDSYGLPCTSWARGHGPYDGSSSFYNPVSSSGPSSGLCSGPC